MSRRLPRDGFTLVELLMSIGIVAVVLTLTAVAVQQVRVRARRMDCLNRLKQIALAVTDDQGSRRVYIGSLTRLQVFAPGPFRQDLGMIGGATTNSQLICPADGKAVAAYEHQSYLLSSGTKFYECGDNNGFRRATYPARSPRPIGPGDVIDGLSNTVMVSERLALGFEAWQLLEHEVAQDALRYPWSMSQNAGACGQEVAAIELCFNHRVSQFPVHTDVAPRTGCERYDHLLPPNSYPCSNPAEGQSPAVNINVAVLPATSLHPGGVNAALCDGSGRFFSSSIDANVWRALGSINGGESIGAY